MRSKHLFTAVMLVFFSFQGFSQDSLVVDSPPSGELSTAEEEKEQDYKPYDALAPSRAAFYSAILPGLGQAFNGSYWKIPIAYGGLGIGVYFYINNDNEFNRFRDAYKDRLAGRVDEFTANGQNITDDGLIRAQRFYRRNKEISILVIAGIYALNIIDANVEAHLQQFNVSEDLTLRPNMNFDEFLGKTRYGFSLNYNF
ncbi:DUF5683 domain-containing protein [Salegentibacter sp.]|uniref:DUF5683 domain-containing protein n=1 Tax=Salegentibacter sp. TaxID=1903072 RepID=UPI00356856F6